MPYRCKICHDCSDNEGFYQSDRDCPSELSDSDAEYLRRWRGRSYRRKYRHRRGSGRTVTRSRPEREETRGNKWKEGDSDNGRTYRKSSRDRNTDSDSDNTTPDFDERNRNTLKTERNLAESEKKKEEDGNKDENKQVPESESTDSDSFWDCSSVSGSETDTGSQKRDRSDEENNIESSDRVKRTASYRPKKDQGNSRGKRSIKNISFVRMPSGVKRPIITPKPKEFKCGTETKKIKLFPTGRTSKKEYKIVEEEMKKSIVYHTNCENAGGCFKKYEIVKIEKLINGCLWKRYRHFQQVIIDEHGFANQRMLFHGSKNVDDIVNSGFDERYSNFNGMFGAGLYFAKHSSKANQYAYGYMGGTGCPVHSDKNCHICERKLLLCRVTLGRSKNVYTAQELAHPPAHYNSVVGVPSKQKGGLKYSEYIVYRGEQIYPEYLITYKIQD